MNIQSLTLLVSIAIATLLFVVPTLRDQELENRFEEQPIPALESEETQHIVQGQQRLPQTRPRPSEVAPVDASTLPNFPSLDVPRDGTWPQTRAETHAPDHGQQSSVMHRTINETSSSELFSLDALPEQGGPGSGVHEAFRGGIPAMTSKSTVIRPEPELAEHAAVPPDSPGNGYLDLDADAANRIDAGLSSFPSTASPTPQLADATDVTLTIPEPESTPEPMETPEHNSEMGYKGWPKIYTGRGPTEPTPQPVDVAWNQLASPPGSGSTRPGAPKRPTARPTFGESTPAGSHEEIPVPLPVRPTTYPGSIHAPHHAAPGIPPRADTQQLPAPRRTYPENTNSSSSVTTHTALPSPNTTVGQPTTPVPSVHDDLNTGPSPLHTLPTSANESVYSGFMRDELPFDECGPCATNGGGSQDSPIFSVGGWFSAGYHSVSNDLFNDRPDRLNLHQGWLFAEQRATEARPLGYRADVMYGIDADNTQSFGNDPGEYDFRNGLDYGAYGWAFPQAYLELAISGLRVRAGHFFTLLGYESVAAPDNFFYSHAMTMVNSEPFTHTGVLLNHQLGDFDVFAGWTLGWDTGFDRFGDGSSWLGGLSYELNNVASLSYFSSAGDFGRRGDEGYAQSVVLDLSLTDDLNYVFQSDYLRVRSTGEDNFGVNQYLLYTLTDQLALGARVEWWKGDVVTGYAPHRAVLPAAGSLSYYAATMGLNIRLIEALIFRPEVRYDWSPTADYDQSYFGIDAIWSF